MKEKILKQSVEWLDQYFSLHTLKRFKVVLFGGEPLLGKSIIKDAIPQFLSLAQKYDMEFCLELVSNGELLSLEIAEFLQKHSWKRAQITLDGPRDVHNLTRSRKNGKPTFDMILTNISMVLLGDYIQKVDVRVNYSDATRKSIPELLETLAATGLQERLELSFGMIMPTQESRFVLTKQLEMRMAKAYISFCETAKVLGFAVPTEFSAGPWCVAVEKHSAVLQPYGALQKCISTVGRSQYDFSTVAEAPCSYAQDERFERFKRQDQCRAEKCPYIPVCGGGCPWDAMVAYGEDGFGMRFCRKDVLDTINRGLLKVHHAKK
jgi:uncharacterized protein